MEELLMKLNMVRKNNEVIRLKREISQKESENNALKDEYKNTFDIFDRRIASINDELCKKIENLEKQNINLKSNIDILKQENLAYKEQIESIPKFILRFFNKKKLLRGEMNDK